MTAPMITIEHIRGLMARTPRSVLLWDRERDTLVFATPTGAYERLTSGGARYLLSRQDLRDSGVSCRDDGTLASGTLTRARELVDELNELAADDGNGIVDL